MIRCMSCLAPVYCLVVEFMIIIILVCRGHSNSTFDQKGGRGLVKKRTKTNNVFGGVGVLAQNNVHFL